MKGSLVLSEASRPVLGPISIFSPTSTWGSASGVNFVFQSPGDGSGLQLTARHRVRRFATPCNICCVCSGTGTGCSQD